MTALPEEKPASKTALKSALIQSEMLSKKLANSRELQDRIEEVVVESSSHLDIPPEALFNHKIIYQEYYHIGTSLNQLDAYVDPPDLWNRDWFVSNTKYYLTAMAELGVDSQKNKITSASLYERMNALNLYAERLVPDFKLISATWKEDMKALIGHLALHYKLQ